MKIITTSNFPFRDNVSLDDFIKEINKFDTIFLLMGLQKISASMANQIYVNINIEFEFYSTPKKNYQIILTKDFISFLAKQSLLLNIKGGKINEIDIIKILYLYGNLISDLDSLNPKNKEAWLWILRSTYQQWFYLRLPSSIMGRYFHLFDLIKQNKKPLYELLERKINMKIEDLQTVGFCIYANYCPRKEGYATSFKIENYTNHTIKKLNNVLTEKNIIKFLDKFSILQENFNKETEKFKISNPNLKKYEYNPLRRYPVIKTKSLNEEEKYIIPSLADFIYCFSEGLYYVLLENLNESEKNDYLKSLGIVFEIYIGELLKYYKLNKKLSAQILRELDYTVNKKQWRTSDWIMISKEYIILIECKKRKLNNYAKVGLDNEDGKGINKITKDIAVELDKMEEKTIHIKSALVDKISYSDQKFIKIIVFLDEMFALNKYGRDNIKEKMETKEDNFYILGSYSFEMICQHAKQNNIDLVEALENFSKDEINDIYNIDYLDKIYKTFSKRHLL